MENSSRFQPGDIVRFKEFDEMIEEFGKKDDGMPNVYYGFNVDMMYLCGQILTVKEVCSDNTITTVEGEENRRSSWNHWYISFDMIEHYHEDDNEEDLDFDFDQIFG